MQRCLAVRLAAGLLVGRPSSVGSPKLDLSCRVLARVLAKAVLTKAVLTKAILTKAVLTKAILTKAVLASIGLASVGPARFILARAGLTVVVLSGA
ncbi:pentapeptide repeat-containing protein [Lamprobacter modestohalophilus]|uniref:pentapeptide repeat-containing protein n=1 Tax=Lamprobacter modestohalophilus TaxID=1064514 RepID=UPI003B848445